MARFDVESKQSYQSQSLTRGILVLRTLAARRSPMTLHELNVVNEIPKPTLVRLLAVLSEIGCVVRLDDRPTYGLGPTMVEIAAGTTLVNDPEQLARPALTALVGQIGHTANLGVVNNGQVLHVSVILADRPVRYTASAGTRDELWCTGLGKALLAQLAREAATDLIRGKRLIRRTPNTITSREALAEDLLAIRQRGWSHDDEEGAIGLRCFAVPLLVAGECVGAVSVSGPSGELAADQADQIVPLLVKTAGELTASSALVAGLRALGGGNGIYLDKAAQGSSS